MKLAPSALLIATLFTVVALARCSYRDASKTETNELQSTDGSRPYNITFERTACFGTCPIFELMIDYTGDVRLHVPGFEDLPSDERRRGIMIFATRLAPKRHADLSRRFDTGGFRKLKLYYSVPMTDGPTTRITVDSLQGQWYTEVYLMPCASERTDWAEEIRRTTDGQEAVPDIFCELSTELDDIACDAYLRGERLGPADNLKPFRPPHCRSPQ